MLIKKKISELNFKASLNFKLSGQAKLRFKMKEAQQIHKDDMVKK